VTFLGWKPTYLIVCLDNTLIMRLKMGPTKDKEVTDIGSDLLLVYLPYQAGSEHEGSVIIVSVLSKRTTVIFILPWEIFPVADCSSPVYVGEWRRIFIQRIIVRLGFQIQPCMDWFPVYNLTQRTVFCVYQFPIWRDYRPTQSLW
jgi:hypothetical protein